MQAPPTGQNLIGIREDQTDFQDQIRLRPSDPNKAINILTDGTSSKGIGFVFYQHPDESNPSEDVTIVQANSSSLKDSQLGYSPVDCEVLALKFATDACYHYLYGAPIVNIYTDCSALQGMFSKPLGEIKNRRIRSMIEKIMSFNLVFHHIPVVENQIADCLSCLTTRILEAEHFSLNEPMLGSYSTVKKVEIKSRVECDDLWVENLAVSTMADAEYKVMVSHIELGTEVYEMPQECE